MSGPRIPEKEPLLLQQGSISPPPKLKMPKKVAEAAQHALGIEGRGDPISLAVAHLPPLPTKGSGSPGLEGDVAALVAMASELERGAYLVVKNGQPATKKGGHFFSNLTNSMKDANTFLGLLVEAYQNAGPEDRKRIKKALESFVNSKWFNKASKKNPKLQFDVQRAFNQMPEKTPYSPKPSLADLLSLSPSTPPLRAASAEETAMLKKADALMDFFSIFPEGITFTIGRQQYLVEPKKNGNGLLFFESQGEKKGRQLGEAAREGQELQPKGEDLPLLMNCIRAYAEKVSLMSDLHASLCRAMVDSLPDAAKKEAARQTVRNIVNYWADEPSWGRYVAGEGVPVPETPGMKVWEQPAKKDKERIPGFKARGPGDEAWFSLKLLGAGNYAGVKQMIRIPPFPDTNITVYGRVRYGKTPFDPEEPLSVDRRRARFKKDIGKKLRIQKQLQKKAAALDPKVQEYKKFVAEIEEVPAYAVGKKVKIRKFSEQVPGTLDEWLYREKDDGSLVFLSKDHLTRQRPKALQTLLDGVRGVRYLHECGFVHKDIKPENIFLPSKQPDAKGNPPVGKIADFGFTTRIKVGAKARLQGTPGYLAPELLEPNQTESTAADLYSLGVTLTQIIDPENLGEKLTDLNTYRVFGRPGSSEEQKTKPVSAQEQKREIKQIQQLLRAKKNPLCDLAADLIDFDPKSRPPIAEVEQRLSVLLQEPERSRILQELS